MIDDEADSASINTNNPNTDPTAINERLRAMLSLFTKSSYVGFTATPFANVFIEPETDHDMLGDDLFPRDYIYALEAPSNYVGPSTVFSDDLAMVRYNDDADDLLPANHKNGHSIEHLPHSLLEALRSFLIATAIRDLRGEGPTHRSMLVNVSRFTSVQDRVAQIVDAELRDIQRDIRNFSHLTAAEAEKIESLHALHETWLREHRDAGFTWAEVLAGLHDFVQPVAVKPVNQRTGAASLDYKANKEHGLRVIAVGGNSLSRGLTLEGLSTSYFYRNSQMYDTLLQMGRWFGYRDGYADLCRVWLSEEALHWYGHITAASEELRDEFKRMRRLEHSPREFGLKVRAHPDSLIVTARNKMRSAEKVTRQISLNSQGIETARLQSNPQVIDFNARHASEFVETLEEAGVKREISEWDNVIWRDVPKGLIATFLKDFQTHPLNYLFQGRELASFLGKTNEEKLQHWDVVLPKGSVETSVVFGGVSVKPSLRRVVPNSKTNSLLISGSRARVGSRGIEREGLTLEEYELVLVQHTDKNVSDVEFRRVRKKPLLLIYAVRGYLRTDADDKAREPYYPDGPPLVALGLSFPEFDDSAIAGKVEFMVNMVLWQSLVGSEVDDDIPSDDDID